MTRVRFAPSPTGYLHVGGARTALFNWLFAKKTRGVFVLRIEDTDKERSSDEHTKVILDGLTWLGITWDEGPVFQGTMTARHRGDAERLLAEGKAYRCFCTKEELEAQRRGGPGGDAFKYDRRCYRLKPAEIKERIEKGMPSVIRFLMPQEEIAWDDAVHGRITFHGKDLDDLVILRSDGTPIYNLAVVSDDIAMKITHVIRGDDHISNTPKQIALYRALGQPAPIFGHVPMILGPDGKKLSKRHGATAVGDYQSQGIVPAAMRNFLALLGWSPGGDREIMTEPEMIELFSLEGIQKKPAIFDLTKLEWMNGQYLSALPADELLPAVRRELGRRGIESNQELRPIIDVVKIRSRTVLDIADQVATRLTTEVPDFDDKSKQLIAKQGETQFREGLKRTVAALDAIPQNNWGPETTLATIKQVAEQQGKKLGDVMQPVRIALTGTTVSEPVNDLLAVVGRERTLRKIRNYLEKVGSAAS